MGKKAIKKSNFPTSKKLSSKFINDIRQMIQETRKEVAVTINSAITMLYWQIGKRINEEILRNKPPEYGKQVLYALSKKLKSEFGKGFNKPNLAYMVRFVRIFPNYKIVYAVRKQLSWTHFRSLIYIDDPLKRKFYTEMCQIENWSTRMLDKQINSLLYERTALSKKPKKLIKKELSVLQTKGKLTPDMVFKDPYFLDFLGLKNTYNERDVESAILHDLESFLIEFGSGISFISRQKRMIIDNEDHYLDLLFYHRKLKRLIAIELKIGKFKAAYKGQMELYLRWLEKYETQKDEDPPLGLILCTEGARETIELLQLDKSGIHVAQYLTDLPSKKVLKAKIRESLQEAKNKIGKS